MKKNPSLPKLKKTKTRHLECMLRPSHWLHEISPPKRIWHHFWLQLIALAKNTLLINCMYLFFVGPCPHRGWGLLHWQVIFNFYLKLASFTLTKVIFLGGMKVDGLGLWGFKIFIPTMMWNNVYIFQPRLRNWNDGRIFQNLLHAIMVILVSFL
jgi:hypothetical protein